MLRTEALDKAPYPCLQTFTCSGTGFILQQRFQQVHARRAKAGTAVTEANA